MPLSEHEQRILEEIERNLRQEDPRLARDARRRSRSEGRGMGLGATVFVLGVVALIFFFLTGSLFVGVAAFGAMVGGLVLVAGSVWGQTAKIGSGLSERMAAKLGRWEEKLRQRYKRM